MKEPIISNLAEARLHHTLIEQLKGIRAEIRSLRFEMQRYNNNLAAQQKTEEQQHEDKERDENTS